MKPRSKNTASVASFGVVCLAPTSRYDRKVPYSVCVRRSMLSAARVRNASSLVSVRVNRPVAAPKPIGMPPPFAPHSVWTRTYEPTFKHVSVPGTYQKPAPYRLQTFTYSTGLALRGRSAACAPATATRPAAEPRRRLFTIFILNLQLTCPWEGSVRVRLHPGRSPLIPVTHPVSSCIRRQICRGVQTRNPARRPGDAPLRRCQADY